MRRCRRDAGFTFFTIRREAPDTACSGPRGPPMGHDGGMRIALVFLWMTAAAGAAEPGWGAYGGDPGGTRYSALRQITRENVGKLKVAWTYHTGALEPKTALNDKAAFEA